MTQSLNKEQADIEKEAEIDVDKAPPQYMNLEAYAWKSGYETGYIAGRTVGSDEIEKLKKENEMLRGLKDVNEILLASAADSMEDMQKEIRQGSDREKEYREELERLYKKYGYESIKQLLNK